MSGTIGVGGVGRVAGGVIVVRHAHGTLDASGGNEAENVCVQEDDRRRPPPLSLVTTGAAAAPHHFFVELIAHPFF